MVAVVAVMTSPRYITWIGTGRTGIGKIIVSTRTAGDALGFGIGKGIAIVAGTPLLRAYYRLARVMANANKTDDALENLNKILQL